MMKFIKSLFTREPPPPTTQAENKRGLGWTLNRKLRQAADRDEKTGSKDFRPMLDNALRKKYYSDLSKLAEVSTYVSPAEKAAMLRHMADRVEKTEDRQIGIQSASARRAVRGEGWFRGPKLVEWEKTRWLKRYSERAAEKQAAPVSAPSGLSALEQRIAAIHAQKAAPDQTPTPPKPTQRRRMKF